jgi:hypothetical protein
MSEMTPEEFWAILHAPVEVKPIFYRLYYNNDGTPLFYSMEDLPGNYIDIDAETYSRRPSNIRVVDSKLKEIKPASLVKKLVPGDRGIECDPRDICIVTDSQPNIKWSLKTNEAD